jgi:hypothetical protein
VFIIALGCAASKTESTELRTKRPIISKTKNTAITEK